MTTTLPPPLSPWKQCFWSVAPRRVNITLTFFFLTVAECRKQSKNIKITNWTVHFVVRKCAPSVLQPPPNKNTSHFPSYFSTFLSPLNSTHIKTQKTPHIPKCNSVEQGYIYMLVQKKNPNCFNIYERRDNTRNQLNNPTLSHCPSTAIRTVYLLYKYDTNIQCTILKKHHASVSDCARTWRCVSYSMWSAYCHILKRSVPCRLGGAEILIRNERMSSLTQKVITSRETAL